jgi:hypothetical protein
LVDAQASSCRHATEDNDKKWSGSEVRDQRSFLKMTNNNVGHIPCQAPKGEMQWPRVESIHSTKMLSQLLYCITHTINRGDMQARQIVYWMYKRV